MISERRGGRSLSLLLCCGVFVVICLSIVAPAWAAAAQRGADDAGEVEDERPRVKLTLGYQGGWTKVR